MMSFVVHRPMSFLLAVVAIGLAALLASPGCSQRQEADRPTGEILSPKAGEVDRTLEVRARLKNVPKDHHVWAATQIGDLLWVKEPAFGAEQEPSVTVVEGGNPPEGMFLLTLLLVPPDGQKVIEVWIERGKKTGEWSGMKLKDIPGATQLGSVKLKLR